jgi:branched-chain amino acid transport system permease protein
MIFFQQLINGLSVGGIYALIALGYTMVYGIILLINFAHGDILMLGAYVGLWVITAVGSGLSGMLSAFVSAMIVCAILAVIIERLAYRPLRGAHAPRLNFLITAMAMSQFLENGARVLPFIGPRPRPFPIGSPVMIKITEGISISNIQIVVIAVSAVMMIILNYIVTSTKNGKAMRAVSFDQDAASLMGISVNKTIAFTFAIGAILAGVGGILYGASYPRLDPLMGIMPGLKAFVAAVLGGIGSIPGAMIGGIILGIVEALTKGFISSQFSDAISFSILIIVLLVKPTGIMGKPLRVKE